MDKIVSIAIPSNARNIVLFVHGFGVRRDSRGMFTDIVNALPKNWGSVLFDFYEIDNNHTYVTSFTDQVTRLNEIHTMLIGQHPESKIHIVAHSMGCIVTAAADLNTAGHILLLAPPESFGTRFEEFFRSVPGTRQIGDNLLVPRKDGTTTHIPNEFFSSISAIDPQETIAAMSKKKKLTILQTTNDEVIGRTTYVGLLDKEDVSITPMPSDHNFTGIFRKKLIKFILDELGADS